MSENKKLIAVSFAALIQTIKSDPQMTNLIHKIATTNDGEQHKDDNNNNALKYLEVNKNSLSDLAEKHYENLVEALTNNAVANTSPNPTLWSSSSTFPSSFDQIDTFRKEGSESFDNSKGDSDDWFRVGLVSFFAIVISVFCKDFILINTESLQHTVLFLYNIYNKGQVLKRKEISWDLVKMLKDTDIGVASISTIIKPLQKVLYNEYPNHK